jgi:hypothetical protein
MHKPPMIRFRWFTKTSIFPQFYLPGHLHACPVAGARTAYARVFGNDVQIMCRGGNRPLRGEKEAREGLRVAEE